MVEDLNRLICDVETNCGRGGIQCDDKGLIKLIKVLISADRRESTVKILKSLSFLKDNNCMSNVINITIFTIFEGQNLAKTTISLNIFLLIGILTNSPLDYVGVLGQELMILVDVRPAAQFGDRGSYEQEWTLSREFVLVNEEVIFGLNGPRGLSEDECLLG